MYEEDVELSSLKSNLNQTHIKLKPEMEQGQTQVDILHDKLMEVKACIHGSEEDSGKELEVLWRRVKTIATSLNYLKCRARVISDPDLANTLRCIKKLEGVVLVEENGTPMSSIDNPDKNLWIRICHHHSSGDREDTCYISEILKVVQMVTNVMDILVKRVIIAESETAIEKEKVTLGQEEVKRKTSQLESMNLRLDEMERFAVGTNTILSDMKQRVEDLVEETCRQRQRATDNEHELCRVKQDFESLKSYVSSLISVRETLLSSEKQFQTIERLFERLVLKTNQLEGEKMQKDVEVLKLVEENVKLSDLLDKKEAQLVAMNEQCKVMALSASHI